MRIRWRAAALSVIAALLIGGKALSVELPAELEQASPEAAALLQGGEETGFGLASGASALLNEALEELREHLLSGVRSVALLIAGVILLGVVEALAPEKGDTVSRYTEMVGALWITAVSAGDLNALIGLGRETITQVSQLSKVLLPTLAAATAAMGGVTSTSVRQVAAVFFSDVLLTAIERLLMPMVYLYIGVAAAEAVLEGEVLEGIAKLLKKCIGWGLGCLLTLFTGYLTISGAVAGAADAQAVRLAKAAVSGAVPVVGGILAEAAESVLAGAGILRGMVGAFGALAVLALCLAPALRLGAQYLLYQGAGLVAAAAGPKKLTKLLGMLGDAFALVLAMTAASALLLIISLVSTLTVVTP